MQTEYMELCTWKTGDKYNRYISTYTRPNGEKHTVGFALAVKFSEKDIQEVRKQAKELHGMV
jgi:hypothetical protein